MKGLVLLVDFTNDLLELSLDKELLQNVSSFVDNKFSQVGYTLSVVYL